MARVVTILQLKLPCHIFFLSQASVPLKNITGAGFPINVLLGNTTSLGQAKFLPEIQLLMIWKLYHTKKNSGNFS